MYPSDLCLHEEQCGHCTVFAGKENTAAQHSEQGAVIILFQEHANAIHFLFHQTGWSPLMLASNKGHSAVVAELLSHGADVELCIYRV